MGIIERINQIEERKRENDRKIDEINKKIEPFQRQKEQYENAIKDSINKMAQPKEAVLKTLKTLVILIMIATTIASMVLIYFNCPFSDPNQTQGNGETYNMLHFVSICVVHCVILIIGIVITCTAGVIKDLFELSLRAKHRQ